MRKRELKRQAQGWQDEFWAAREKIDLLQVQLRQAFKRNQQVDKERVDWKRWCRAAEGRAAALAEVLREIAEQDEVENALDPQWAARIAKAALTSPVKCPHGVAECPCNDGDPCNYEDWEGTKAMPSPSPLSEERKDGPPQWYEAVCDTCAAFKPKCRSDEFGATVCVDCAWERVEERNRLMYRINEALDAHERDEQARWVDDMPTPKQEST